MDLSGVRIMGMAGIEVREIASHAPDCLPITVVFGVFVHELGYFADTTHNCVVHVWILIAWHGFSNQSLPSQDIRFDTSKHEICRIKRDF